MNEFIICETLLNKDEKEKLMGEGEWCKEPDHVEFDYKNYRCCIKRQFHQGGYLCGYVNIPKNLIIFNEEYLDFDVHGGITWNEITNEKHWIGFDCAHHGDFCPTIEHILKNDSNWVKMKKETDDLIKKLNLNSNLYKKIYRNLEFCVNQCKSLVEQIIKME